MAGISSGQTIAETTSAAGLSGATTISPGDEVQIFSIGLTGNGAASLSDVELKLLGLPGQGAATVQSDFSQLRLYTSTDATLDGGDTLIGSVAQGAINIGSATTISAGSPDTPPNGVERFYIVSAVMNTTVTDGHGFKLRFQNNKVTTSAGGEGSGFAANNANNVTIDVVATQLVFTAQPAGSVSGVALTTQPVVTAQDAQGNTDADFVDTVTLTEGSAGSLSNNSVSAVSGVATFTNLIYSATADQESFTLSADDVSGGAEGDLPSAGASAVTSDVVATQLVFTTQPAPLNAVSGSVLDFSTDPVVEAQNAAGVRDADFTDTVTLLETGAGSATYTNNSVSAVSGVATFTNLTVTYTATADQESFTLSADDVSGGAEGDLPSVGTGAVTSDVMATQLVFTTQPAPLNAVSGNALDFSTDPVVEAQNAAGIRNTDFTDTVTLLETGAGTATYTNNSVSAVRVVQENNNELFLFLSI